ncbi:MAG TPA: AMP-binding protein [Sulfuriferula sp.]|nr:AMP-binding protein [Sulfuriferula sp.]
MAVTAQVKFVEPGAAESLYTRFLDTLTRFGRERVALEDIRQPRYSYGELLKITLALGRLASKITAPDEHVGVLMPNLASTVCLMLGMNAFRRVPAMLNYSAGVQNLLNACTAAQVKTVITSRQFLKIAELEQQAARLGEQVRLVYLEDMRAGFGWLDKAWLMGYALRFPARAASPGNADAQAVVLFTSGSEGKPKGVVLSNRALLANVDQICAAIDFSRDEKFFNALPIFHSFGLTAGVLLPLLTGVSSMLYTTPLHYKQIPEMIRARGSTVLFGTSTFFANYAKFAAVEDFRSLRIVVAGAEKLAESVRETWRSKFGIELIEGYGATETAPVLAVNPLTDIRPGSVGHLLPGVDARLVPIPGIRSGGVLHVRGPNLMLGYYRVEHPGVLEPPASEVGSGWYNTGDVVEIDRDGFVHIVGRVKRFAKVAGEMISLETVEAIAAQAAPEFQHGAATAQDEQRGEAIVLFTTAPGLSRERMLEAARIMGMPEIAVPRRFEYIETLPVLSTGKVDYVSLQALASGI